MTKTAVVSLGKEEQKILKAARPKIGKIKQDMVHSIGLSGEELAVAVKVRMIDPDQAWWWTEEWQKGEREVQKEIDKGNVLGPFTTVEQLKAAMMLGGPSEAIKPPAKDRIKLSLPRTSRDENRGRKGKCTFGGAPTAFILNSHGRVPTS